MMITCIVNYYHYYCDFYLLLYPQY